MSDAFLKGHAMERGTLMVLKRFFLMALAGLTVGLGGKAWAQGDGIPAPKLYDGATDCTTAVPSVVKPPRPGAMSALDNALEDFDPITGTGLVGVVTAGADCDNNDVASQFDLAKRLYDDAAAAKRLTVGDDPDPLAVADYAEKKAARDAFGGTIYEALYTQYDRQAGAQKSINDYNEVVQATTGTFTVAKERYDGINITTTNTNLIGYTADDPATTDTDETVIGDFGGRNGVEGFQDIMGFAGSGSTSAAVVAGEFTDTFNTLLEGAFTTGGTLRLATTTVGTTTTATVSTDVATLGTISTYLNEWNDIVKAAAKHLADGTTNEVSNLPELQESLRRVTAVRDHVQAEQRRLVNVLRAKNYEYDHDGAADTDEVTVSNVLRAYDTELAKRKSAADSVRSSVTALENARNALHAAMRNPGTFLGQVVDRRQYEKDQADANVAEFDAGEAPESVTKAAENAAMALMAAQDDLDAHTALVGDEDNPASALLQALLEDPALPNGKPNPADDDGQALIDAISTTYETANAAHDEAHEAYEKAEAVEESVMGLTGEGGAVATNTNNITSLDGRVTANEETLVDHGMKLMQKKEYIDNLAAEIGIDPVTGEGTMEGGMSRIDYNAMGIIDNAENIAANAGNIMTNSSNIMENRGMIEMNSGSIAMNSAGISSNADAIASNMNSIGQNSSAISDNRNMIGELSEDLDVVRAGVAASMALAGMPAINGRGVSIGVGSFDGESAFAVGFQIQGEMASFKVGVTSASGATGASAGVGFQF